MATPTSRTLNLLKKDGKIAETVERYNCFSGMRRDFLNFIDIIAIDVKEKKTIGIQCTSTGNVNARIKKICGECKESAIAWLSAGNHIEVIGWSKKGARGKRKLWTPTKRIITMEDF